jgi:hypothetical protein
MFLRDLLITILASFYFAGGIGTFVCVVNSYLEPDRKISRAEFLLSLLFLPITVSCLVLAVLPTLVAFYVAELLIKYKVTDWLKSPMFGGKDD